GRLKRGGDKVIRTQTFAEGAEPASQDHPDALVLVASKEPTPESAAIVQELLDALSDPILRAIALERMDGLSNVEIARKLGCAVRTVERKIERIRVIWAEIGAAADD